MFSTSTRLAIIASRFLAEAYYHGVYLPSADIAMEYGMNAITLMATLDKLKNAGLLNCQTEGNSPCYMFARDPKTITMLHIITALEGSLFVNCVAKDVDVKCDCSDCYKCIYYVTIHDGVEEIKSQLGKQTVYQHYISVNK